MVEDNKTHITLEELKKVTDTSEKLALEIRMLSRAFKKINSSGLKKETIVLLLHDYSNVGKPDIRLIIKAFENMESQYTNTEKVN